MVSASIHNFRTSVKSGAEKPWVRAFPIGGAVGYGQGGSHHHGDTLTTTAIRKRYERHADEFNKHNLAPVEYTENIGDGTPRVRRDHRLTSSAACGSLELPNYRRRSRRLCVAPQREKSGSSCFCRLSTSWGVGYILAEQRPGVREAPAAFDKPGSVVPPFLFPNPEIIEVHHV